MGSSSFVASESIEKSMQTRRLFLGIPLSPALARRLEREMRVFEGWPIIPTRKQNLHVTVLFLGFVAEENLPDIVTAVQAAVIGVEPFELRFERIGFYPDDLHPTAVFLSGEEQSTLLTLRQNLDRELGYLVPEKKSFRPHVTLGKIRRGRYEALTEKPNFTKEVNLVEPVSSIVLFESVSEEGKREYTPLEEFSLVA